MKIHRPYHCESLVDWVRRVAPETKKGPWQIAIGPNDNGSLLVARPYPNSGWAILPDGRQVFASTRVTEDVARAVLAVHEREIANMLG